MTNVYHCYPEVVDAMCIGNFTTTVYTCYLHIFKRCQIIYYTQHGSSNQFFTAKLSKYTYFAMIHVSDTKAVCKKGHSQLQLMKTTKQTNEQFTMRTNEI